MATVDMNLQEATSWLERLKEYNGTLQSIVKTSDSVVQDIANSGQGGILNNFVDSYERVTESTGKLVDAFSRFANSLSGLFEKAGGFVGEVTDLIKEVGKYIF